MQVHIMYQNLSAARWALSLLTARPHDDSSRVHTWYWAAAIAMHGREWRRAQNLFVQAARCTLEYPHMSMRSKALVGVCEAMLADTVATVCPDLAPERFVLAVEGQSELCACALHAQLCRSLHSSMQEPSPGFAHGKLARLKELVCQALKDAQGAQDPGAELRVLLIARFILETEGLVAFAPGDGRLEWASDAKPGWCTTGRSSLSWQQRRLGVLMEQLQRNVFVTRSLLGCFVVLDPKAMWDMHVALQAGQKCG